MQAVVLVLGRLNCSRTEKSQNTQNTPSFCLNRTSTISHLIEQSDPLWDCIPWNRTIIHFSAVFSVVFMSIVNGVTILSNSEITKCYNLVVTPTLPCKLHIDRCDRLIQLRNDNSLSGRFREIKRSTTISSLNHQSIRTIRRSQQSVDHNDQDIRMPLPLEQRQ
jgi:hypothetical protein